MAHYVFQRNNGFGDFDYIRSFETMEITDYPEYAAQVDDKYLVYIDMPYLNSLGFYAVGITSLALRILPALLFRPLVRGYRPVGAPRPPRAHVPGAVPPVRAPRMPRPARVVAPRPAGPAPRVAAPKPVAPRPAGPAPRPAGPAPRPAGPAPRPVGPAMRPAGGPAKGPGPGGRRGPGGR